MEALPSYNDRGPLADDSFSSSNAHFALDPQLAQLDVPTDSLDLLGPSSDHPYSTHDLDQDPHRQHPFLGHHDPSPSFFDPSFGYAPMDTSLDQSFPSHPDMSLDAYGPSSSHNADGFLADQSFPPIPNYTLQQPTLPPYGAQSGSVASGSAGEPSGSNKGKGKKAEKDKPAEKGVVKKTSGNGSRGPRGPYKKRPKIQIIPDSECSFCDGTNERNRDGKPEEMISCFSCGRSGHPSCLQMQTTKLIRAVRSYAWKCIECKTCEACQVKGDDTKLLFCDYCDRGYHLDCLDPPLTQPPKGSWGCPQCRKPRPSGVSSTSASSSKTPNRHAQASAETPQTASRSSVAKGKQPASLKLRMRRRSSEEEVEEEEDGKPKEPFGGVLRGADADTSRSKIQEDDLTRFEASWTAAEAKLGEPRPTESSSFTPTTSRYASPSAFSSSQQRPRDRLTALQTNDPSSRYSSPAPSSSSHLQPYETPTPSLEKIKCIRFGKFDIDIWYSAPYPEEYALVPDGRLWMCEFCLKYMKSSFGAERHKLKCKARHPPGDEVYREGSVSVFEVDGRKNKIYCQNLCLLAKMFLDHKTLYYDVEPFLFYIMTETDEAGARFVGYFSKEKRSPMEYNVSCILTLPVRQRKGWGNLLIDFSYLLSKKEARVGSPEKPLSSLGLLSYTRYWTTAVFAFLKTAQRPVTIEQISSSTSMTPEDIIFTLTSHQMITIAEPASPPALPHSSSSPNHAEPNAAPRGLALRNLVSADTATTVSTATASGSTRETDLKLASALAVPKAYTIDWDPAVVEEYLAKFESKGWLKINPIKLSWSPFLLEARSSLTVLARETGAPVVVEPAKQEATELPSHGILADTLVPQTVAVSIDVDMEAAPDQREPVQAAVEV